VHRRADDRSRQPAVAGQVVGCGIVVAADVDDLRAGVLAGAEVVDHRLVLRRPARQRMPAVEDVADEEVGVRPVALEEPEHQVGAGTDGAEMQVRQEKAAMVAHEPSVIDAVRHALLLSPPARGIN